MAKEVDPIVLKIEAEFGTIKDDLAKLKKDIKGAGDGAESANESFGKMKDRLMEVATAIIAVATATGLLVNKQLDAAKSTKLWADRLSITQTSFSQLAAVGARFGVQMDDVGDSIKDLNERIADAARGNKTYETALNMVGLRSKELINLPVDVQFLKVADAIGRMNNAGDRNFATAEQMADAGFRLIPMFQQGEKAIRAMAGSLLENNAALSEYNAKKLERINQDILKVKLAVEAMGNALAIKLAPGLKVAAHWANELADAANKALGVDKTSLKERLKEVNEELKKFQKVGVTLDQGGDRSAANTNSKVLTKIRLLQEKADIENSLASMETSRLDDPTGGVATSGEVNRLPPITVTGDGVTEPTVIEAELERVEKLLQDKALLKLNYQRIEEEEHQSFLDREFGAEKKDAERNKKLWAAGWEGRRKLTSETLGDIAQLMNTGNRKMFEVGKAAAMAQVAIDTPKAAMSAFAGMAAAIPGPVGIAAGIAAAAAAVAMGASRIQQIQSTSFGGGGGGVGGSVASGEGGAGAQQQTQENVIDATFNIQGTSVSKDQLRGLASGLNELVEDGAKLRSVRVI